MSYNFKRDCRNILRHIKTPKQRGGCMPYDTGHLANDATQGQSFGDNDFTITINTTDEKTGAPYAVPLNTGSVPHDIPNSFNRGYNYGIGGRFNGKFHPGSLKHVGFYDNADDTNSVLGYTLNYFVKHYDAVVKKE